MAETTATKVGEPVRQEGDAASTDQRLEAARRRLATAPVEPVTPPVSRWTNWYNR
jgi:hypothetical protein